MRDALWFAVVVALAALSGCSDELAGPKSDIRDARAAWERADYASYEYVYQQSCYCPLIEAVRIVVESDSVTAAFYVDAGGSVTAEQLSWLPTVAGLFDRLEDVLEQDPVQYEAEFDPELGYPRRASVDISRQIADEEFSFTASELQGR